MVRIDIEIINTIAIEAGKKILQIYDRPDFNIEFKKDDSPLTAADKAAHHTIAYRLGRQYPDIPLLSEEGKSISHNVRHAWPRFWLVDPLDGTKEFIKRNGEFTVNIALIENNQPVLGVIYAPVIDTLYYGIRSEGAFRQIKNKKVENISVHADMGQEIIAVRSRSHGSEEEEEYARSVGCHKIISAGSSLKFCRVAEGQAHYYYRHGPTMEWDTAAGHAIVEAAGGVVSGLTYNKNDLRNGPFLARSTDRLPDIPLSYNE